MPGTPGEKVRNANDDYHEAIDEVLMDDVCSVNCKTDIGHLARGIFIKMDEIKRIINANYPVEE